MPVGSLRFKQLKAVRLIRSGSAPEQVCKALHLQPDSIKEWESACRNVPDDILARLEHVLSDNEKLRRLVAGLGNAESPRRFATESD
ncbi:MAG TPA: hypothetical protein VLC97_09645 [Rhodanobacteraceae bacterium]|nr:hypothetical protein [Rhodanobacteraceae bacterium]